MSAKTRVSNIVDPSATLAIKGRMAALKDMGVDTISLGAGELKFPLSEDQKKALQYIAADPEVSLGYTAAPGLPQTRAAVALKQKMDHGIEYDPNTEVLITDGGKGALLALFLTTFGNLDNPDYDGGTEVIYPAPYWLSHSPIAETSGATMVPVECPASQDYKITPEQLRAAITDKTKFVVLTSPHNPGGTSYTEKEWEALAEVLREHPHVIAVTEDMYEHYIFDGAERTHLLKVAPDLKDRVVGVNCVSKSDEMAGERVGYLTGPADILGPTKALNSNLLGNAPVLGQWLTIAAILGFEQFKLAYDDPKAFMAQINSDAAQEGFEQASARRDKKIPVLEEWRDKVLAEFAKTALVTPKPGGSFYAFPSIEKLKGLKFPETLPLADGLDEAKLAKLGMKSFAGREITCAQDFADAAMIHTGVGVVPGQDFEAPDSFRIAYTEERSVEAAKRIAWLANQLAPAA